MSSQMRIRPHIVSFDDSIIFYDLPTKSENGLSMMLQPGLAEIANKK